MQHALSIIAFTNALAMCILLLTVSWPSCKQQTGGLRTAAAQSLSVGSDNMGAGAEATATEFELFEEPCSWAPLGARAGVGKVGKSAEVQQQVSRSWCNVAAPPPRLLLLPLSAWLQPDSSKRTMHTAASTHIRYTNQTASCMIWRLSGSLPVLATACPAKYAKMCKLRIQQEAPGQLSGTCRLNNREMTTCKAEGRNCTDTHHAAGICLAARTANCTCC
jgi:hypothetical protein